MCASSIAASAAPTAAPAESTGVARVSIRVIRSCTTSATTPSISFASTGSVSFARGHRSRRVWRVTSMEMATATIAHSSSIRRPRATQRLRRECSPCWPTARAPHATVCPVRSAALHSATAVRARGSPRRISRCRSIRSRCACRSAPRCRSTSPIRWARPICCCTARTSCVDGGSHRSPISSCCSYAVSIRPRHATSTK